MCGEGEAEFWVEQDAVEDIEGRRAGVLVHVACWWEDCVWTLAFEIFAGVFLGMCDVVGAGVHVVGDQGRNVCEPWSWFWDNLADSMMGGWARSTDLEASALLVAVHVD